mmetsp:Transcript_31668/g.35462  ORF Transcript_31668/g.35462 Transcript_31668/m.35462 type:complete len:597 (-) Transcript_31668:114-1904(-)
MSNSASSLMCAFFLLLVIPAVNGWVLSLSTFKDTKHNRNGCKSIFSRNIFSYSYSCDRDLSSALFVTSIKEEKEEEQNVIEYLDLDVDDDNDDDDANEDTGVDYSPEEALAKQTEWMKQLRQLTRTTSKNTSAVALAEGIFDDMFRTYAETDDITFWPTVEVYNLLLEIHAYSRSSNGGDEAERILNRMEDTSNILIARPNEQSYLCVMDGWVTRREPEKVKSILDKQTEYSMKNNNDDDDDDNDSDNKNLSLRPTVNAYNKLIKAYGIAGDFVRAEDVFRLLLDGESDSTIPRANHKSWVQIMKSYAFSHVEDSNEIVQSLFEEMSSAYRAGEEEYLPQTDAYNVLIRTIGKKQDGPQKAEAMLFEMIERFRNGEEEVRPNSETFRSVLAAYKYTGRGRKFTAASVAAKVEQILQIREGLLLSYNNVESDDSSESDERIFRTAMWIVGRSRDTKKAKRAKRIFQKYSGTFLSNRLHYYLLMSCANQDGNSEVKFEAFQTALGVMKELRSLSELEIDSSITGMFIKACNNLMPDGPKRDDIVKHTFQDCCRRGYANEFVLNEFGKVASEPLQLEILGGYSVDGVRIPKSWCDNIVN